MRDTPKSKSELIIEQLMRELDPTSPRYQVLAVARQFKSSWVELGEQLNKVKHAREFRGWGYESFEDYCTREIRIRKETALKLTNAYRFLEQEEPGLLAAERRMQPLPDYRAVDLLRQAHEEQQFSNDEYAHLRAIVIDNERSLPTVQKHFREVALRHNPAADDPLKQIHAALSSAQRLEMQLRELAEFPSSLVAPLSSIIAELAKHEAQLAAASGAGEDSPDPPHSAGHTEGNAGG